VEDISNNPEQRQGHFGHAFLCTFLSVIVDCEG